MEISHETLVWLAKTFGLFYLIAMSVVAALYAFWPSNGERFDKASRSILNDEDGPCR